jgi:FkbM family methyltransferase
MKSLTRVGKRVVKNFLRDLNYHVSRAPKKEVNGFNLVDDLRQVVKEEHPVCFDVGANEGQTIGLLQQTFDNPRIYAFEPSTACFEILESRHFQSEVVLTRMALGSECGEMTLINYEYSTLNSFLELNEGPDNCFRSVAVKDKETVKVCTVDWFVKEKQIQKIHLLKTDTQGFDLEVLKGAAGSLGAGIIENVFVELNFIKMYKGQGDAYEISRFLASFGMHLIDYYEKERRGHTLGWCTALYGKR